MFVYVADGKDLPTVPPIAVTVPEDYPVTSPVCETDTTGYGTCVYINPVTSPL